MGDKRPIEEIFWEALSLLTGSSPEMQSSGLIRLRQELAERLGKPDPQKDLRKEIKP